MSPRVLMNLLNEYFARPAEPFIVFSQRLRGRIHLVV